MTPSGSTPGPNSRKNPDFALDACYIVTHYSGMESTGGPTEPMRTWIAQLRKGLVELCVMAALQDGEAYGYEILQRLGDAGNLAVTESTVYPILVRLAKDDLVEVRVAPSPAGPPRRYYRLTGAGRARLADMRRYWHTLVESVNELVSGGSP